MILRTLIAAQEQHGSAMPNVSAAAKQEGPMRRSLVTVILTSVTMLMLATSGSGTLSAAGTPTTPAQASGPQDRTLEGTWRVLKPGGLLFCRLASSIGMEHQVLPVADRRCLLPDGSERYLVDEALLSRATDDLGGRMIDPLKTTVVQNERCMTTWEVQKNG